jgi:ATP-dependent DNA ligase
MKQAFRHIAVGNAGCLLLHEIKHDGFRILARHNAAVIRLITRARNDFSSRFPYS